MSYQTAKTIDEVIKNIDTKKYLLPSIQREFVWSKNQIEKLFDSLMQGYPINAFLFWNVPKEKVGEFSFYDFLRNYHQKNKRHNEKANVNGSNDIVAVLDGQQRLTSLYIGLKGSYADKIAYKRWDNPDAFPETKLYLDLFNEAESVDVKYRFKFLTENESKTANAKGEEYWFPVGKVLDMQELPDVYTYLSVNKLMYVRNPGDEKRVDFASRTLAKLFTAIKVTPTISYYEECSTELDKVLNIFIRVNSGGTTLSYSDLLLSFATAQWDNLDAREEINKFTDEINMIGKGFNIGKDIVLKSCLMLCDFPDISFKVDNFNRTNMLLIEQKWSILTKYIKMAVRLVSSFGFSRENITSNNLFIPIAYYLYTKQVDDSFVSSSKTMDDRKKIKKWFISTLLAKAFSFMPDGLLKPVRDIIRNNHASFPLDEIKLRFKGTNRDLNFTDDDIDNLLWAKYGSGESWVIISLLYPWADLNNVYHEDHIHPRSKFTRAKLNKLQYTDDKINFYIEHVNYLPNLQLLPGTLNIEKNDKYFKDWFDEIYKDPQERKDYCDKHYIPNVGLEFDNFQDFFEARKQLMFDALKAILA